MPVTIENPASAIAIRPFTIPTVPEAEFDALRARITDTRWPDHKAVTDDSLGVPLAMVQELAILRGTAQHPDRGRLAGADRSGRPSAATSSTR